MLLACASIMTVAVWQAQAQIGGGELLELQNFTYHEGDRYFYMPDASGILQLCDSQEPPSPLYLDRVKNTKDVASYLLYTRQNQNSPQYIRTDDRQSVQMSNFYPDRDTKVLVHGWGGSASTHMNTVLKKGFLSAGDVNVIIVDYELVAGGAYLWATWYSGDVARSLASFLRFVYGGGVAGARLHLVGFSLGGQVVGIAGRQLGGQVARITSLDPALPLWGPLSARLRRTDALYVEVIHTNAHVSGQAAALGDVDFYPNGGTRMAGCAPLQFGCSHARSYEYFAESLRRDLFVGRRCASVAQALGLRCQGRDTLTMGNMALSKDKEGVFSLRTNAAHPYARG